LHLACSVKSALWKGFYEKRAEKIFWLRPAGNRKILLKYNYWPSSGILGLMPGYCLTCLKESAELWPGRGGLGRHNLFKVARQINRNYYIIEQSAQPADGASCAAYWLRQPGRPLLAGKPTGLRLDLGGLQSVISMENVLS
jgi:hypothetical protein